MNRLNIYYCPKCRNVGLAYGKPEVQCCGCKTGPVVMENGGARHTISEMDGEFLLEFANPMTKDDYVAAVVVERYDRVELIRLFPEQAAAVRVAQVRGATIYILFCRQGKVWSEVLR